MDRKAAEHRHPDNEYIAFYNLNVVKENSYEIVYVFIYKQYTLIIYIMILLV